MTSKFKKQPLEFVREDDYVEYFLYPEVSSISELQKLLDEINEIVKEFSKEYIWHKDAFNLKIRDSEEDTVILEDTLKHIDTSSESTKGPILHGVTHYGDNIQDEWFIVALILKLTKNFKGLIARIIDSDGEFLLIEAANHLPKWANPEKCEGKVFLFNGMVHICREAENSEDYSLVKMLEMIRTNSSKFCISNAAFESIHDRVRQYPENIRENHHIATLYVPLAIASILKNRPNLLSAAVLAFCNRDPIDQKVLRAMRYFPPEERVYTSVKFTKCLYAMLMHNHFIPDRRTGWNLPSVKAPEHKAHLNGIKVACGFEILASQANKATDLDSDKNWHRYLDSLKDKNYFQGLLEGSKDYVRLLEKAENFYKEHCNSEKTTTFIAKETLDMLRNVDQDKSELISAQKSLPKEDSDDWLNISSQDLDEMLEKRYGQKSVIQNKISNDGESSKTLSHILSDFLEQKSEFDGIDEPNELNEKKTKKSNKNKKTKGGNIEFNPDEFQAAMQNLLELVIPEDKWDSNSDMSDYDNDDDLEKNLEDMNLGRNGEKSEFDEYMEDMDRELAKTTIGASFEKKKVTKASIDDFDDIEDFQPVDIDANTVKNMMESYKAQMGATGPATNLLGTLGVRLEEQRNKSTCDEKKTNGELKNTTV
uniref:CSON010150 protein n=1 Tax=Culicoides sonorensis TaxID=179676 RepID=A0A336LLL9_CULSO